MLGSILSSQQNLQWETVSVMNKMSERHENEQCIRDTQIFDGKNIDFDEWVVQIKKVAFLTGKSEYTLALAKSNTPYKLILQCSSEAPWDNLKKWQDVHSMIATEYNTATDLLRKQRTSESLQEYTAYWMEMCHCSIKIDPSTVNNKLVIALFVKNMYNKEIGRRVAGAKNIIILFNAFQSGQVNIVI